MITKFKIIIQWIYIVMQNNGIEETIVEWWIQKEIESYDKAIELHPKYPYIWYKLGLTYDSIWYTQKAKEYFHRMETTKGGKREEIKWYN